MQLSLVRLRSESSSLSLDNQLSAAYSTVYSIHTEDKYERIILMNMCRWLLGQFNSNLPVSEVLYALNTAQKLEVSNLVTLRYPDEKLVLDVG